MQHVLDRSTYSPSPARDRHTREIRLQTPRQLTTDNVPKTRRQRAMMIPHHRLHNLHMVQQIRRITPDHHVLLAQQLPRIPTRTPARRPRSPHNRTRRPRIQNNLQRRYIQPHRLNHNFHHPFLPEIISARAHTHARTRGSFVNPPENQKIFDIMLEIIGKR